MSEKAKDSHNRWRSLTIAFRISPEDNEMLNRYVAVSGLTKQDYITQKVLNHQINVTGNPRVYIGLKEQLTLVYNELSRLKSASEVSDETYQFIEHLLLICENMNKQN